MKVVKNTDETPGAAGVESMTLNELLAAKAEFASIKGQAFRELKFFSSKLLGIMLLVDDLAGLASIEEATAKVRQENETALSERNDLAADISRKRATAADLRARNTELADQ